MKDIGVYFEQVLTCLEHLSDYTASGLDDFLTSSMIQDAVFRNIQVIGQAVKRIPEETRLQYSDIPWRNLTGLRDVIVHDYDELILDEIWVTVRNDLIPLKPRFAEILRELDENKK